MLGPVFSIVCGGEAYVASMYWNLGYYSNFIGDESLKQELHEGFLLGFDAQMQLVPENVEMGIGWGVFVCNKVIDSTQIADTNDTRGGILIAPKIGYRFLNSDYVLADLHCKGHVHVWFPEYYEANTELMKRTHLTFGVEIGGGLDFFTGADNSIRIEGGYLESILFRESSMVFKVGYNINSFELHGK